MTKKLEEYRSPDKRKQVIKMSNRFADLEEEEVLKDENAHCGIFMIGRRSIFQHEEKSQQKIKQKEFSCRPKKIKSTINFKNLETHKSNCVVSEYHEEGLLKKFETGNRFYILSDNQEEDLLKILRTPKQSLKKCRKCNFKKRTCILDPLSCKAVKSVCLKCQRFGHFPQSGCCKDQRKSRNIQS